MGKDEVLVAPVCIYRNALRLVLSTERAATLVQMLASVPLGGLVHEGHYGHTMGIIRIQNV